MDQKQTYLVRVSRETRAKISIEVDQLKVATLAAGVKRYSVDVICRDYRTKRLGEEKQKIIANLPKKKSPFDRKAHYLLVTALRNGFSNREEYEAARQFAKTANKKARELAKSQTLKEKTARKHGFTSRAEYEAWHASKHSKKKQSAEKRQAELARRASVKAERAESKRKYEEQLAYFAANKEAIKQAAYDRRRQREAQAAGFDSHEAWVAHRTAEHIRKKAERAGKVAETKRIRDQWRDYRRRIKQGMATNGGRIPRGFIDTQFEKQNGCCGLCLKPLDKNFHIDHIIPVSKGGENLPENLHLTHDVCNMRKNDSLPAWLEEIITTKSDV